MAASKKHQKTRWLPPTRWLAEYRAAWLPGDIIAGITEGIEDKVGGLNRSVTLDRLLRGNFV
jgi:hypothetical protein